MNSSVAQNQSASASANAPSKRSAPINLSLLGYLFKRHSILFAVITLCVAAYSLMIIAIWPLFIDEGMQQTMEQLAAVMPGFDTEAFSMSLGQYLETQWLGVYWLPLAGAVLIVVAARSIAGSVADGSLETIFATPLSRMSYLNTVVLALLVMSLALSIATVAPLALAAPIFDAEISAQTALLLGGAGWVALFVFGLVVLALSSWTRGIAKSESIAVAIIILMIVLYIATPYVEFLEVLEPLNLLHWWGAGDIIDTGKAEAGLWIWLALVGVVSMGLSYGKFLRRDLA